MSWAIATNGRTIHLETIDIDVDPQSETAYVSAPIGGIKLEGYGEIGTWRLPSDKEACATVLWRLWHLLPPDEVVSDPYLGQILLQGFAADNRKRRVQ